MKQLYITFFDFIYFFIVVNKMVINISPDISRKINMTYRCRVFHVIIFPKPPERLAGIFYRSKPFRESAACVKREIRL